MKVTTKDKDGNITDVFIGTWKQWQDRLGIRKKKESNMTKAKQLLLESSLIVKDMEIFVLKEKLKELSLLQLKTNRQLAKMPNWIKWLFK